MRLGPRSEALVALLPVRISAGVDEQRLSLVEKAETSEVLMPVSARVFPPVEEHEENIPVPAALKPSVLQETPIDIDHLRLKNYDIILDNSPDENPPPMDAQ